LAEHKKRHVENPLAVFAAQLPLARLRGDQTFAVALVFCLTAVACVLFARGSLGSIEALVAFLSLLAFVWHVFTDVERRRKVRGSRATLSSMSKPRGHRDDLWYEHDYDPVVNGLYKNKSVHVIHVEGPLRSPLRAPHPDAAPGSLQDIPIDQDMATFTVEFTWPEDRGRVVVPFAEVTFPV
jgi:hypothetical protein